MIIKNKILFRFIFILSCLLIIPFPLNIYSKFEWPQEILNSIYHKLIPWFGKHILHLDNDITQFTGGSGDTTYDYVLLLFFVIVSILASVIWTVLTKNQNNEKINYIFEIILRYYLGYFMLYYGFAKVFYLQFSELSYYKLLHTYGNSSPMGILWTFMGASKGYTIFSGLMECIGGILLLHRKTRLLGALILIPVLGNVVALNFFYDVPVKLFSTQLLIFAILILLPHMNGITRLILHNKPITPNEPKTFFDKGKLRKVRPIVKWLVAGLILIFPFLTSFDYSQERSSKPELYGLYEVNNFIKNNDTIQPMLKDSASWRYIAIERLKSIQIYSNDMSRRGYETKVDTTTNEISMKSYKDSTNVFLLSFKKSDSLLTLNGIIQKDTISIISKRIDKKDFLLLNRGFHWINETPYHR